MVKSLNEMVRYLQSFFNKETSEYRENHLANNMVEMKTLKVDDWKFLYNREVALPFSDYEFKLNGQFIKPDYFKHQPEVKIGEDITKYRDKENRPVLVLHEEIPTFDSGDRQYDSYKELYIWAVKDHLEAVLVRGGYLLGKVLFYPEISCADVSTKQLLESAQMLSIGASAKPKQADYKCDREYVFECGNKRGMHLHCARLTQAVNYVNQVTHTKVVLIDEAKRIVNFPGIERENQWTSCLSSEHYLEPVVRFTVDLEQYDDRKYIMIWEVQPDGRYWEDDDGFGGEAEEEIRLYAFLDKEGKYMGPFRIYNVGGKEYLE